MNSHRVSLLPPCGLLNSSPGMRLCLVSSSGSNFSLSFTALNGLHCGDHQQIPYSKETTAAGPGVPYMDTNPRNAGLSGSEEFLRNSDSGPGIITNGGLGKGVGDQLLHKTEIHTAADYLHESPIEQAQVQNSYAASG